MLAGGEKNIQLTPVRGFGGLMGQREKFVRDPGHGRKDNDHVVSLIVCFYHAVGHITDPRGIGDRGSAVFLND